MWLVSADTCGGGTRDEALKVSAWEASNTGSKKLICLDRWRSRGWIDWELY